MKMTRDATGYVLESLTVVKVQADSGLMGGSSNIELRPARLPRSGVKVRPNHIPMYIGERVVERVE